MAVVFRINDYGADVRVSITQDGAAQDISQYTTLQMIFRHTRTGTTKTRTAAFLTDGADGYIHYTLASGDLDRAGEWQLRGHIAKTDAEHSSEWEIFTVTA
jgi:hypothetical protein